MTDRIPHPLHPLPLPDAFEPERVEHHEADPAPFDFDACLRMGEAFKT